MVLNHIYFFIFAIFLPGNVSAHAELSHTIPVNGEMLEKSPEEFVIHFSEPVSIIRVQLLNHAREVIALNGTNEISKELIFEPVTSLEQGQYLFSFRVLSLDAHPVSGSIGFAIGDFPSPLPEFTKVNKTALMIAYINQTIHLIAVLASIGLVLFPLLFKVSDMLELQRQYYINVTAAIGLITTISGLGLWGVLLREAAPSALFELDTWLITMGTSFKTSSALVASGLLGIIIANILDPNLSPGKLSSLLGIFLIMAAFGASGHAASSGLIVSSVFILHATMAGIWFGSLWLIDRYVVLGLPATIISLLRQFSTRLIMVIFLLLMCALILSWYQLGEIGQLIDSEYGNWLILKMGLVILILILAAFNRWRFAPAIEHQGTTARRNLHRSIYIEGLLMIVVIAVTVVLASTPPPSKTAPAASQTTMLTVGDVDKIVLSMLD